MHKKHPTDYRDKPPHYSFKIPHQQLQGFYNNCDYYEVCEACIDDMYEFIETFYRPKALDYGNANAPLQTTTFYLDDDYENNQFHLVCFDITGIDGATAGLIENAWQKKLNYQQNILSIHSIH